MMERKTWDATALLRGACALLMLVCILFCGSISNVGVGAHDPVRP